MQTQFSNPFHNIPKISKGVAGILVFFYLFGLVFPSSKYFLALTPGYTIPPHFYVWNLVTSGFYETSLVNLIVSVIAVLLFGKYLEPIWGSKEYVRFLLIVITSSGSGTFIYMIFLYFLFQSEQLWFSSSSGFSAAIAGFSVALKQMIPEQELDILYAFKIRAKHLPAICLSLNFIFAILRFTSGALLFALFGTLFSWVYLRFYQKKGDVVGDFNESFSFASFFPDAMQTPIIIISNITFKVFVALKCCKPRTPSSNTIIDDYIPDADPDSERRRARALKALDQKIQQMKQPNESKDNIPEV